MTFLTNEYEARDYGIHSINDYLAEGNPLIPENHEQRIKDIKKFKMIYAGERDVLGRYYKDELIKYGVFKDNNFNAMMIISNYCRKATNDVIETSISTPPVITVNKKQDNNKLQSYLRNTDLLTKKLQQIFMNLHITGNCFVRVINDGKRKTAQILGTEQVFVITDIMTNETIAYIVYTLFTVKENNREKQKARFLVSERGVDTIYEANISNASMYDLKMISRKNTGTDEFSIYNFVINPMIDNYEYGVSAYSDADALQSNLIRNLNTVEVVVEKFSQPILTGPELNEENNGDCEVSVINLPMGGVSVGDTSTRKKLELSGNYVANDSDKDLKYVEYHGAIEETLSFIGWLKNELISALGGDELLDENKDFSRLDSSKAYRMLFLRLLNICDKYTHGITDTLIKLLSRLVNIGESSEVNVFWQTGLPDFPDERVEYATNRINNGTFSTIDAISYIEDISYEEAKKKAERIKKDEENLGKIQEPNEQKINEI